MRRRSSRSDGHLASQEHRDKIPVIGLDCGIFKDTTQAGADSRHAVGEVDGVDASLAPILCFKDKRLKTVHADVVSCKGLQDLLEVDATVHHNMQLGYPEVIVRVDSDTAAKALPDAVAAKRKEKNVRVVIQSLPQYDSSSPGATESSVQQIKDKTRLLVLRSS